MTIPIAVFDVLDYLKMWIDKAIANRDSLEYDDYIDRVRILYRIIFLLLYEYDRESLEFLKNEVVNYCREKGMSNWDIIVMFSE